MNKYDEETRTALLPPVAQANRGCQVSTQTEHQISSKKTSDAGKALSLTVKRLS